MHIVFSGGKTLGHVMPLINIYLGIQDLHDTQYTYFGLHDSMEERECERHKIPFFPMKLYPFYRKKIWKNYFTFREIFRVKKEIIQYFKKNHITCVIASGGFVSIPVVLAAKSCKIKIILLEQNVVMGLGNKWLSHYATHIGLTFPLKTKMNGKMKVIGNPITHVSSDFQHPIFYKLSKKVLLIGGSNGAKFFMQIAKELEECNLKDISILLVTGKKYQDEVIFTHPNVYQVSFIPNLSGILDRFDGVVARAGSSTMCELIEKNIPGILIPSPNVTNQHQFHNANYGRQQGAFDLLEEKEYSIKVFYQKLHEILFHEETRKKMIDNQQKILKKNCIAEVKKWILE